MAQAMGSRSYGEDGLDQEMRTHVTYTLTVGHLAAPASQLVFGKTRLLPVTAMHYLGSTHF